MSVVLLKPGHVQPVWTGHPWVYAQAVERVEGGATAGDEVSVVDPRGNLIGRGFYSPGSAIPVRLLVRDAKTQLDASFFRARIQRAIALRAFLGLPSEQTTGFRLVHAEGDGLPGLIVDRYGDVLVIQLGTIGMKHREALVHEALLGLLAPRAIIDRTSAQTAKAEGFDPSSGVVRGEPVDALELVERGLKFRIPLELGQKTGFYFDQRALRARVEQLAHGAERVLDAYAFVGSFAISAARGGAREVVAVDDSALAVEVGAECAVANGVGERVTFVKGDARRALAEARGSFDLVIADPPRFAPARSARDQALIAYTKLAENACRATKPGGIAVFCSCSAAIDLPSLTRALAIGAMRANTQATVLERWFQGADHPVPAAFGEGLYLKALIARVDAR
ncbi:MAG: class I SAM-dependent rRNA methyltransferase [Myxococcota bacterium]|nr:class I SAM-dependent rRNA methyltransferase [Myxococcota bacterium]